MDSFAINRQRRISAKAARNANYLEKRGYTLYENWDEDAEIVDAKKINGEMSAQEFSLPHCAKTWKIKCFG